MATGDVPDSVGHGQYSQTKRQRNANKSDAEIGNAAARTAEPHPPNTSQNVPKNSPIVFFVRDMMDSPQWDGNAARAVRILVTPLPESY
jgi:hypothetical protein